MRVLETSIGSGDMSVKMGGCDRNAAHSIGGDTAPPEWVRTAGGGPPSLDWAIRKALRLRIG